MRTIQSWQDAGRHRFRFACSNRNSWKCISCNL